MLSWCCLGVAAVSQYVKSGFLDDVQPSWRWLAEAR